MKQITIVLGLILTIALGATAQKNKTITDTTDIHKNQKGQGHIQFRIPAEHASFDSLGQTMYFIQNYEGVDLQLNIIDSVPFNDDSIPADPYSSLAQVMQVTTQGELESYTDAQLYNHNAVQFQAKEIGISFMGGPDKHFLFMQMYFLNDKILTITAMAKQEYLSDLLIAKKFFFKSLKLK
jgi:hypothetical protein